MEMRVILSLIILSLFGSFFFCWGKSYGEGKYSTEGMVTKLKVLPPGPNHTKGMTIVHFQDGRVKKMYGRPPNVIQERSINSFIFTPEPYSEILTSSIKLSF